MRSQQGTVPYSCNNFRIHPVKWCQSLLYLGSLKYFLLFITLNLAFSRAGVVTRPLTQEIILLWIYRCALTDSFIEARSQLRCTSLVTGETDMFANGTGCALGELCALYNRMQWPPGFKQTSVCMDITVHHHNPLLLPWWAGFCIWWAVVHPADAPRETTPCGRRRGWSRMTHANVPPLRILFLQMRHLPPHVIGDSIWVWVWRYPPSVIILCVLTNSFERWINP